MRDSHYSCYSLYGLRVRSALECPALRPGSDGPPDVTIRYGPVAGESSDRVIAQPDGPDAFLLHIPGVARFRVVAGREIVVDRAPESADAAVRLFLLGSAMGALLHQRGITPIHGSAVDTGHGGLIFSGPQGHGKSTLAAAFAQRGYPLLSDDVCPLTADAGSVWLHPAWPRLNLLPDALDRLEIPRAGGVQPFTGKHLVPVARFAEQPTRLLTLYELHPAAVSRVQLHELQGYDRLTCLMGNTYRVQFVRQMGHADRHFTALQEIARQVRVVRVERPATGYRLDELVAAIAADCSHPFL